VQRSTASAGSPHLHLKQKLHPVERRCGGARNNASDASSSGHARAVEHLEQARGCPSWLAGLCRRVHTRVADSARLLRLRSPAACVLHAQRRGRQSRDRQRCAKTARSRFFSKAKRPASAALLRQAPLYRAKFARSASVAGGRWAPAGPRRKNPVQMYDSRRFRCQRCPSG